MRRNYNDFVGQKINNITIISFNRKNCGKRFRPYFECLCFCGNIFWARSDHILNNKIKSCSCIAIQLAASARTLPNNQAAINVIIKNYKSSAKKRGFTFDLSVEKFKELIFLDCFYCGTCPKEHIFKPSKNKTHVLVYNGIDRVDPKIGYVNTNCVPCCQQCNYAKTDLSLDKFKIWIRQLIKFNIQTDKEINI